MVMINYSRKREPGGNRLFDGLGPLDKYLVKFRSLVAVCLERLNNLELGILRRNIYG